MTKAKKIVLSVVVALLALLLVAGITFYAVFHNEIKTLNSLEKADEYGFYTMEYYSDYGFDEFLKVGAKNDAEVAKFAVNHIMKGLPVPYSLPDLGDAACSTFNAETPNGENIFGRNFDLDYAPSILVKTTPKNGYKSFSVINLAFMGYGENKLPDTFMDSIITLAAPYTPADGMNEKGLCAGILLIPDAPTAQNTGKIPLNTTAAIRLVLDKAATVDEAIELLEQYDMNSSANSCFHYQLADAQGNSAVIDYVDNEMNVVRSEKPYQACTNFLQTPGEKYNMGIGQDRYETLMNILSKNKGIIPQKQAMDALKAARQPKELDKKDGKIHQTQWSVVYNQDKLTADVAVGSDYSTVYSYSLMK